MKCGWLPQAICCVTDDICRNEGWLLSEWVLVILLMCTRIHYWARVLTVLMMLESWMWICRDPSVFAIYIDIVIWELIFVSDFSTRCSRYWQSELKCVFQRILSESFSWSNRRSTWSSCTSMFSLLYVLVWVVWGTLFEHWTLELNLFDRLTMVLLLLLWSPYVIGQTMICSCCFFLSSFFFLA